MYYNYTIAATLLIFCLGFLSKIATAEGSDERTTRSRTENLRRSLKGQSNKNHSEDDVQEAYIAQQLDHFDATNDATFQQRYFVSYRHHHSKGIDESKNVGATSSSLPTISLLCVGGEGPGFTKSVLVDSVHCSGDMLELAKRIAKTAPHQYNIVLYALEHRYYGKSYPEFKNGNHTTSPLTVENLRFLSSRQALEDLAHFVQTMNRNTDASSSNTWVTFGGSYPGMMSLYARYKYPHLIFASVSSSAPIKVTVDFPGYKAKQGWDLKYETIGGSAKCHDIVKTGHNQAVALLKEKAGNNTNTTDGSVRLAKQFNLCNPDTVLSKRRNQDSLLGDGLINIMSQNNDQACTENDLCNIAGLCRFLIDQVEDLELSKSLDGRGNVELEALARTAQKQYQLEREQRARKGDGNDQQDGHQEANQNSQQWMSLQQRQRRLGNDNDDDDCVNVDYEETVKAFSNTTIKPFGFRSWLWQTCTEFGFYQTCGDDCPFASYFHSVDMDLELCNRLFNISSDAVYDNVQATLDHYGGKDFLNSGASRILTINGDVDPWSVLGLNKDDDDSNYLLPIKMVKGASHHFWTHAVKNTDDREIIKIREFIYSCVMNWLGIETTATTTTTMPGAANSIVANDVVASYGNSLFYEALKR